MDHKPMNNPEPEKRPRAVRGNDRNLGTPPPGQRPDRFNPPIDKPASATAFLAAWMGTFH